MREFRAENSMSPAAPEPFAKDSIPLPDVTELTLGEQKLSVRIKALLDEPREQDPSWHVLLGEAMFAYGDLDGALLHTRRAADLATDDIVLSDALRLWTYLQFYLGNARQAKEIVTRLHGIAYGSRANHAMSNYFEAQGLFRHRTGDLSTGGYFEAESRYRSAMRGWETLGNVAGRLRMHDELGNALAATGWYAGVIEQCDLGLTLCVEEEAWYAVPRLLLNRAFALRDFGLHDSAEAYFLLTLKWAEAIEDMSVLMRAWMGYMVLTGYSITPQDVSRLPQFDRLREKAIDCARRSQAISRIVEIHHRAAELYQKIGLDDRAAEELRQAVQLAESGHDEAVRDYFAGQEVEQRELEATRQERLHDRLRETIEGTPDALLILDPVKTADGQTAALINEYRNSAGDRLCGCASTDVLSLEQLGHLAAFEGLPAAITGALESRTPYADEFQIPGTEVCLERRVVIVGDGVAVTLRDVSLHHAAEKALREAAASAKEADRAKSVFLANMSHEVRTPINGVLGLARLLSETNLDGEQRNYVEGIVASADILLGVLGDVLDISKIEAGRVELSPSPIELRKLVSDVVALFSGQARANDVSLSAEIAPTTPEVVEVDGIRLRQVLANLVGNAIKFTHAGWIRVKVTPTDAYVRFEVSDTGQGVPADRTETIFEAFRQGANEFGSHGGTGLGLTISRRLVELMGGTIGVVSRVGEGSLFWFELPLREVSPPLAEKPAERTDYAGLRVLLVEDNPVNTMVASGLLSYSGCSVEAVTDGEEAVRRASQQTYDMILMDVRMPGMDGLEATRRIRAAETTRRVPIVALTASAFVGDRDECYQAGMDDYLGKPFTVEALRAVLARWAPPAA